MCKVKSSFEARYNFIGNDLVNANDLAMSRVALLVPGFPFKNELYDMRRVEIEAK
jgi:hypothetical protein